MKCPFRVDETGDFKECYGSECMAYFEYEAMPFAHLSDQLSSAVPEKQTMINCKKMAIYAPSLNYCV